MSSSSSDFGSDLTEEINALSDEAISGDIIQLRELLDLAVEDRTAREYQPTGVESRLNSWAKSFFPESLIEPKFDGDIVNLWVRPNLVRPSLPAETEGFLKLINLLYQGLTEEVVFIKTVSEDTNNPKAGAFYVSLDVKSPSRATIRSSYVAGEKSSLRSKDFEGEPKEMWEKFLSFNPVSPKAEK